MWEMRIVVSELVYLFPENHLKYKLHPPFHVYKGIPLHQESYVIIRPFPINMVCKTPPSWKRGASCVLWWVCVFHKARSPLLVLCDNKMKLMKLPWNECIWTRMVIYTTYRRLQSSKNADWVRRFPCHNNIKIGEEKWKLELLASWRAGLLFKLA